MTGLFQYSYEPHITTLPNAAGTLPMWCGPHRFSHPDDPHPNDMNFHAFYETNRLAYMALDRQQDEIKRWCIDQTGRLGDFRQRGLWAIYGFHFFFRRDNDAFAFRLRWC